MSVDAPTEADDYVVLTDWLELVALFSERHRARIDLIAGAFEIGEDTCVEDIGVADQESEDHSDHLSEEVSRRSEALTEDAYPFVMSDNGEELFLKPNLTYGHKAYLASLIHEHSRNSGKLSGDHKMSNREAARGRDLFEIFAVFAMHSFCADGQTFHIGKNRSNQQGLLAMLSTASAIIGEGIVEELANVPDFAPVEVNDGGVDIIGVQQEHDGPPGIWHFGQSAAGADYISKSADTEVRSFCRIWYSTAPATVRGIMLVSFMMDRHEAERQSPRLGHVLHRLRLPLHALKGKALYDNDNSKVHFVDEPESPCQWLDDYVRRVRAI